VDVSQAFHQSTHSDPGPGFPWPEFMSVVTAGETTSEDGDAAMAGFQVIPFEWPANGEHKIVVPVGSASRFVGSGFFSLACDGLLASYDVWFQGDNGGLGEKHGSLAKDQRMWCPIPDGCTQIVVHTTATGPVGATLELGGK
jgi:hypothetical protein